MNSNKRIGIFTLHRALNYGAVWQCWALKNACESFGNEVETIDYNPFGDYQKKWFIKKRPTIAYKYLTWLRQFNHFVEERLNPTQHTVSHEWIKNNPPIDEVYIVGSDTVWSDIVVGEFLDSYLLDFAPVNVRRISYAASTGGNPMELNEYQLGELRKFSAISVREKQSVPDVQAMVDIPVTDVCDPTLLLTKDEYEKLEQKPFWLPKHYIVYLDLAGDLLGMEAAKLISNALHLPVVSVGGKYMHWVKRNYLAPTPEQWLYILHHADYICTNSFHGVAFSIIYRRPFVCCAAQIGKRAKTNGRVQNLLYQTGLKDRYVADTEGVCELLQQEIQFNDSIIETYRSRSLEWLKKAIEL